MSAGPKGVTDHGLVFEFHTDGVDLIDTWAPGQPRVRFSLAEYEAFHRGVQAGEFDLEVLKARAQEPDE
jgi:hypothetical protein